MLYRSLCWRVIEKAVFEDFTCVVSNSISSTTAVNSTYTLPILATRQPIHRNRLYFSRTAMLPTTSRSLPAPTRSFSMASDSRVQRIHSDLTCRWSTEPPSECSIYSDDGIQRPLTRRKGSSSSMAHNLLKRTTEDDFQVSFEVGLLSLALRH